MRALLIALAAVASASCCEAAIFAPGTAQSQEAAIVTTDQAVLRGAPRDGGQQQAQLWQGDLLEVRGERLDYLQVYDHRRERAGFVKASQVRRTRMTAAEAPDLLAVIRFVRDTPGDESLGIALAAAYLQAATSETLRSEAGIEALDALGTMADRLAHRTSWGANLSKPQQATLAAHLEVARGHGVVFASQEREGRMQVCYDGDAFRRVLAMPATPQQQARAALALTRPECAGGEGKPLERHAVDQWRANVLDKVDVALLPPYLKNRVLMRRAAVWSSIAYQQVRFGKDGSEAAQRAMAELAGVAKAELTDVDQPAYSDAAMRVNATRWAAVKTPAGNARQPSIVTVAGQPGETCVLLVDAKNGTDKPLVRRCTWGLVWAASASLNREGNAMALAVQPLETWRETWVFRKQGASWAVSVLPPSNLNPELGYSEFAGWVPGGKQVLIAREVRSEGRYKRNFEVVQLDSLVVAKQSPDADALGPFQRWSDPRWKRESVALR